MKAKLSLKRGGGGGEGVLSRWKILSDETFKKTKQILTAVDSYANESFGSKETCLSFSAKNYYCVIFPNLANLKQSLRGRVHVYVFLIRHFWSTKYFFQQLVF